MRKKIPVADQITSLNGRLPEGVADFFRFGIVGAFSLGLNIVLLWAILTLSDFHYLIATALAFFISVTVNFFLNRAWTFGESREDVKSSYVYYALLAIIVLGITLLLMTFFVETLSLPVLVARAASGMFAGTLNYLVNARFNFHTI